MNRNIRSILTVACLILFLSAECYAQSSDQVIANLNQQLKQGKLTLSDVLSSDSFMYLHSQTPFRDMIKSNAKESNVTIITPSEPGTRITVKGHVTDKTGTPLKHALVYFYQTSDKGWYSDTAAHILILEGDIRHARLFGYLKTDDKGNFTIETIKPKGYPKSDLAAHIHIHFWDQQGNALNGPGELQFEDDPRMTADRKKVSLSDGFLIAKNSGTAEKPVYDYKIVVEK